MKTKWPPFSLKKYEKITLFTNFRHLTKVNQGHWFNFYSGLSQQSFWCQHYENRAKTKEGMLKNIAKTTIFEKSLTFDLFLIRPT